MDNQKTTTILLLLYGVITAGIIMYITTKMNEESSRCSTITSHASSIPKPGNEHAVGSIGPTRLPDSNPDIYLEKSGSGNTAKYRFRFNSLVNCHIKTAYNCCAINSFKNSFVSECALETCIKSGARCLDFEIYSVNDMPVIGLSSKEKNVNMKESYNKMDFSKAMRRINSLAFSQSDVGNQMTTEFPLILHFRLKSRNKIIYDVMAKDLFNAFGTTDRLLTSQFSYLNEKKKLRDDNAWNTDVYSIPLMFIPVNSPVLKGKVIVIFEVSSLDFNSATAFENWYVGAEEGGGMALNYVNIISPSKHCGKLNDFQITSGSETEKNSIRGENKERLTFSHPNVMSSSQNVDFKLHKEVGCQMIGMCFQNYNKNIETNQIAKYHKWFSENAALIRKSGATKNNTNEELDKEYAIELQVNQPAQASAYINKIANPAASST